jgi:putative transposase
MGELGLDARLKKQFKVQTTDSNHNDSIAPRIIKTKEPETLPQGPGEGLVGDITYLRLGDKFVYLAKVLDLFNREILGWSMGNSLETSLVLNALDMAMRKVGPDVEVTFHSDRGSQYQK